MEAGISQAVPVTFLVVMDKSLVTIFFTILRAKNFYIGSFPIAELFSE